MTNQPTLTDERAGTMDTLVEQMTELAAEIRRIRGRVDGMIETARQVGVPGQLSTLVGVGMTLDDIAGGLELEVER